MGKLCHKALKDHSRYDSLWGGLKILQGHLLLLKTGLRVPCSASVVWALIVQIASLVLISEGSSVTQGSCWATVPVTDSQNIGVERPEGLHLSWGSHISGEEPGASCVFSSFFLCLRTFLFLGLLLFAKYTFKDLYIHIHTHHPSNTNTEGS